MRVAVVDIGTNSTRLLVADVGGGGLTELARESTVTRLGEGVDATGELGVEPQERVFQTLARYRAIIDDHGATAAPTVMTSAVRDARNGAEFAAEVQRRFGFEGRTLSGEEEARLSFLGATAARAAEDPEELLVIDIGGGSTEMITGRGGTMTFHTSTQTGVVRQTERHISTDPPEPAELQKLAAEVRPMLTGAVPEDVRASAEMAIAVAGTATSLAAIDLKLDPYDADAVEGHQVPLGRLEELLAWLAGMTLAERRGVIGLDPARAPTIVAGVIILIEVLRAFHLDTVAISERDILWGVALTGRLSD